MLEFSILAILATCVAGMIQLATSKREALPVWQRENRKIEVEKWMRRFLANLKRTSTRTQKCRIISAIERTDFENYRYAGWWKHVQFGEENVEIIAYTNYSLQKIKISELVD